MIVTLSSLTSICGCAEKVESIISIQRSLFRKHGFGLPTFSKKCLTYTFEDGREFQSVQIKWLSKDTIEFNLTADWMPCVFEQKGVAVLTPHSSDRNKQKQGNKSFQACFSKQNLLVQVKIKLVCGIFYIHDDMY